MRDHNYVVTSSMALNLPLNTLGLIITYNVLNLYKVFHIQASGIQLHTYKQGHEGFA